MYERDGIIYAGEPKVPLKIIHIMVERDWILKALFNDGETRTYDFSQQLEFPVFLPLKDKRIFDNVSLRRGVPTWNGGEIDIAPEVLYYDGK